MTHQNHETRAHTATGRAAAVLGAAVLGLGLLLPLAGQADHARLGIEPAMSARAAQVRHCDDEPHFARPARHLEHSPYFTKPHQPLNFKRWLRVERQLHQYVPHTGGLNHHELRAALHHSYERYLRDHRRWSRRADSEWAGHGPVYGDRRYDRW